MDDDMINYPNDKLNKISFKKMVDKKIL